MKPTKEAVELFLQGSDAFADIEQNGMRVDVPKLKQTMAKVKEEITETTNQLETDPAYKLWSRIYGKTMNLDSPEQLRRILYKEMQLPCSVWTPGGRSGKAQPSTSKIALDLIDTPFTQKLTKLRELNKINGTFLGNISRELVGNYVRSFLNLHTVRTYRSSSSMPNGHNYPKRNEELSKLVRENIIPEDDHYIVEWDFKGIEVSVSACYNKDPVLIDYIKNPKSDMHRDTACQLFLLAEEEVDKKGTRDSAKNMFVFPQFYGSVYFQCAPPIWEAMKRRNFMVKGTNTTIREHLASKGITELGACNPDEEPVEGTFEYLVKEVENDFWQNRFKVYAQWKKDTWYEYQRKGYFQSLTGFVYEGVFKRNEILNYGIQGSAFHCLLWTLIRFNNWLKKYKMKSRIINQIHDSIIASIHKDELQDCMDCVWDIATRQLAKHWDWINVPMVIEVEVGKKNWFELEPYNLTNGIWAPSKS